MMRCSAMVRSLIIAPLALALIGCGRPSPVAEDAVNAGEAAVEAAIANALPASGEAAETARQAALPPSVEGMRWTYRPADRLAEFGPPGSPAFSIQCFVQREGARQLVFVRHVAPATGKGTLSFTGNGQVASVPVASVMNPDGIGGHWRGTLAPGDIANDVAETLDGPATVEVSISGSPPLIILAGPEPRKVIADCQSG